MCGWKLIAQTVATILLGHTTAVSAPQPPAVRAFDERVLREYTGVYRWERNAFVYLQMWDEFNGFGKPAQLVAFDESGEVRTRSLHVAISGHINKRVAGSIGF
jgi:hypothetical protein